MPRYDDDYFDRIDLRGNSRDAIRSRVFAPAIAMGVISGHSLLGYIVGLGFLLFVLAVAPPRNRPDDMIPLVFGTGACLIMIVIRATMIAGAFMMARMQYYPFAIAAAVLLMVPLCSFCWIIEVPFGIWAFVVLLQPDVREGFYSPEP